MDAALVASTNPKGWQPRKARVKQEQTRTTEVDYSIGTVTVPIRNRAMGALVTKSQLPRHRCASRQGADGSIMGAPSILKAWMLAHPQKTQKYTQRNKQIRAAYIGSRCLLSAPRSEGSRQAPGWLQVLCDRHRPPAAPCRLVGLFLITRPPPPPHTHTHTHTETPNPHPPH